MSHAGPLSLQLTQLEPRLVTATGPQTLTVVGVLTNTGKVPVSDLEIRVQRGAAAGHRGRGPRRAGRQRRHRRRPAPVRAAARRARARRPAAGPAGRAAARPARLQPRAQHAPACTSCWSTSTGCRGTVPGPGWPRSGCCCRCSRCRPTRPSPSTAGADDRARRVTVHPALPHRRHARGGCPRCPASRPCSPTTSWPRRWPRTAGWAGWSPRWPPLRSGPRCATPPAWPSTRTWCRRRSRCASGLPGRRVRRRAADARDRGRGRRPLGGLAGRRGPRRLRARAAVRRRRPGRAEPGRAGPAGRDRADRRAGSC